MSLTAKVREIGEQAKHAPTTIDASDVRSVCLQVLEVLELFGDITRVQVDAGTETTYRQLVIKSNIDDYAQPLSVLAGISDQ